MADDLTGNPWVIDTAGAKTAAELRIARIAWKNVTLAGDTVLIQDGSTKTIFEDFATVAKYNTSEPINRVYTGLTVATLSSGKLYVTFDLKPKIH